MKSLLVLAILSTGLFFTSCDKCNDDCIDKEKRSKNRDSFCTREYAPVCGCDDVTYSNACEAERNGLIKYTEGECSNKR